MGVLHIESVDSRSDGSSKVCSGGTMHIESERGKYRLHDRAGPGSLHFLESDSTSAIHTNLCAQPPGRRHESSDDHGLSLHKNKLCFLEQKTRRGAFSLFSRR